MDESQLENNAIATKQDILAIRQDIAALEAKLSKKIGGETILENLQILCALHNRAKGNVEYDTK